MERIENNKGHIHLYTGNGKGKTTAAIGLAIRAAGAKKKVFIAQFIKGMQYSELETLKRIPEIEFKQYGLNCFIINEPTQNDIDSARKGLAEVISILAQKKYDILVLDEICISLYYKLFEINELLELLKAKPEETEIVMTGRYAPKVLYEIADLVTEMNEIKHYYKNGVEARQGIEY